MSVSSVKEGREILTSMSHQDFLNFGMHDVVYIKSVEKDGRKLLGVHAADGHVAGIFDDEAEFWRSVMDKGMDVLSVH